MSQKLILIGLLISQVSLLITVATLFVMVVRMRQDQPEETEVEDLDAALGRSDLSDTTVPVTYPGTVYPGRDRRPR